ncbi:SOSS complex subunit B family protein [Nanoarchaeota archaeon]
MAIKDLQARQGNVEVEGVITEVSDAREFEKFGKQGRVANAKLKDDTGEVKLTLWNEQIDQLKVGDRVKVTKGYVGEWQGELQLTTGKFGTLEVLGDAPEGAATADNVTEADALSGVGEAPKVEESVTPDEKVESELPSEKLDVEEEDLS